jgi:hypothetical protein
VAPKISAGINLYPSPEVEKTALRLEVSYTSTTYKTTGNLGYYDPDVKSDLNLVQNILSFIPQFQYSLYNTDPFKFYIDAGLSINFSFFSGNSVFSHVTNQYEYGFLSTNVHGLTVPLKAGIILKKNIDISVTYVLPTSETNYVNGTTQEFNYSLNVSMLQATLSYIF